MKDQKDKSNVLGREDRKERFCCCEDEDVFLKHLPFSVSLLTFTLLDIVSLPEHLPFVTIVRAVELSREITLTCVTGS
jgi:hypothetical protein